MLSQSSSSSDTATSHPSSSSDTTSTIPPNHIQLPPPPCFSAFSFSFSPSHPSPDPFDRTPTSPNIYYTAPSSPYSESPANSAPSSPLKSPGSPPPLPALHITIPTGPLPQSPNKDSSHDEAFPPTEMAIDLAMDDEGLSPLERIYLFSTSKDPFHRVFIVHAMPSFLEQVTPLEADEYVLPLLRGLAMDDDETVKEALAAELVPIIWWFFTHCQIVPDDVKVHEYGQPSSSLTTTICVQAFTPILGTLLLSPNPMVGGPARRAVVEILSKMRKADIQDGLVPASPQPINTPLTDQLEFDPSSDEEEDLVIGLFGKVEREMFEQELLQQVVIGMGRLDMKTEDSKGVYSYDYLYDEWDHPGHTHQPKDVNIKPEDCPSRDIAISSNAMDIDQVPQKTPMVEDPVNPYFPHHIPASSPSNSSSSESTPSTGTTSSTAVSSPSSAIECIDAQENGSSDNGSTASPSYDGITIESTIPPGAFWIDSDMLDEDKFYDAEYFLPNEVSSSPSNSSSASSPGSGSISLQYEAFEYPPNAAVDIDDYGDDLDVDAEQAAVGRVSSMSLMAATAASGTLREEAKFAFVKEVERVGHDSVHWVRREASFAVGALAKVVPQELVVYSLLPLFESLRRDPVWHVRQSALFALPAVLSRLSPKRRRSLALETILPLSKDDSTHVRSGVLEALGEVIYTFHKDKRGPPEQLLHLFLGRREDKRLRDVQQEIGDLESRAKQCILESVLGSPTRLMTPISHASRSSSLNGVVDPLDAFFLDPERPMICAFNFPAVVATLGKDRWGELREVYLQLAENRAPRVRRTLAASLGAIAKIIGEENAAVDLMTVWWDAIRCEEDEVRTKAVECVGEFVAALGENGRLDVIRGVLKLWMEGLFRNWRERESIAKILGDLTRLTGVKDAVTLRGLLMVALQDGVAAIRDAAVSALPAVWRTFLVDLLALKDLHDDITSLSRSSNHRWRMTFVACQYVLIAPVGGQAAVLVADDDYWLSLLPLARDKIIGVRIGVARLVGVYLNEFHRDSHQVSSGTLLDIVNTLRADSSHEVRSYFPGWWQLSGPRVDTGVTEQTAFRLQDGKSSIFSKPPPLPMKPSSVEPRRKALAATEQTSLQVEDIGTVLLNKLQQLGERISPEADLLTYATSGIFSNANTELAAQAIVPS